MFPRESACGRCDARGSAHGQHDRRGCIHGQRDPRGSTNGQRDPRGSTHGQRDPRGSTRGQRDYRGSTCGQSDLRGSNCSHQDPTGVSTGSTHAWRVSTCARFFSTGNIHAYFPSGSTHAHLFPHKVCLYSLCFLKECLIPSCTLREHLWLFNGQHPYTHLSIRKHLCPPCSQDFHIVLSGNNNPTRSTHAFQDPSESVRSSWEHTWRNCALCPPVASTDGRRSIVHGAGELWLIPPISYFYLLVEMLCLQILFKKHSLNKPNITKICMFFQQNIKYAMWKSRTRWNRFKSPAHSEEAVKEFQLVLSLIFTYF